MTEMNPADAEPEPESLSRPTWHVGRGVVGNPTNRFVGTWEQWADDLDPAAEPAPTTRFLDDTTKSVLNAQDSPDLPFTYSFNAYRGCEHGCSYCYARPYHEYLGLSAGLDFESVILVKHQAPRLVREALSKPGYVPATIGMSGATDCYQPAERRFRLTRACLEVLAEFRQPVGLITKNALVARDADLLAELARHHAVSVCLSITTLDQGLQQQLEPRASVPAARLQAIRTLVAAGVPVGVNAAPLIPGLTDHELPAILAAAAEAGATHAGYQFVRLPLGVADLFSAWLDRFAPAAKAKILDRIRAVHGGQLDDPAFTRRFDGAGPWAEQTAQVFRLHCRRLGLDHGFPTLSAVAFRSPHGRQQSIFDLG